MAESGGAKGHLNVHLWGRISLKPDRWLVNGKLSAFGREEAVLKIERLAQALRIGVLTATNRMSANAVGSTSCRNALSIWLRLASNNATEKAKLISVSAGLRKSGRYLGLS
jgi:hypothetical protein